MAGLTLDTGALIALERRNLRIDRACTAARRAGLVITVPSAVVVEWWRGQQGIARRLLAPFDVEPLTRELAHIAGEALANVTGPSAVDAVVMASAAQRATADSRRRSLNGGPIIAEPLCVTLARVRRNAIPGYRSSRAGGTRIFE